MSEKLSASEALYGFAAWLSCRDKKIAIGASCNAAPLADLVKEFCEANELDEPANGWEKNLTHPS